MMLTASQWVEDFDSVSGTVFGFLFGLALIWWLFGPFKSKTKDGK